ncbi:MAG TPA: beta-N-acetylhexosaminidase [Thioploca sp.]|nr:beta-N-acetylhexosaminidase [Thioploca sp.]
MSLGPLMIDLEGYTINDAERKLLQHPLVGGVILFSRNYESIEQINYLATEIHALRKPKLLIAVDHEGGRIQRFKKDFFHLPACAKLGEIYEQNNRQAIGLAEQMGWLLAAELRAVGIDFSFAPVLDLGRNISTVIGDRALHSNPEVVSELAHAIMLGMRKAGMIAVGKHFPGHGSIATDSHIAVPVDERRFVDMQFEDLVPFERMIKYGLAAIMPAHVIYPQIDSQPAGFSSRWLQSILRKKYEFQGVIISDDICMAGAVIIGDPVTRATRALQAGCDMILICNDRDVAIQVIDNLGKYNSPASQMRLMRLHGKPALNWHNLHVNQKWQQIQKNLTSYLA